MRTLTTILLLATWTVSFGQNSGLKGQVIDNGQNPLAGLTIKILDCDSVVTWTVTGQNGDYELQNIKPGLYDLSIQHLGFRERILED